MAIISNGTTVATGGNVEASTLTGTASAINGSNITNIPAPSSSSIMSAVASTTAGSVGAHGLFFLTGGSGSYSNGSTISGSGIKYSSASGNRTGSTVSGTWRCFGSAIGGNYDARHITVWKRIS
jgi:hypothetical protein